MSRRKTNSNAGRKTIASRSFSEFVPEGNRLSPRLSFWRAAFARLTPSQWVEKHIKLPPGKTETTAGPIRFDYSPYLREVVDSADEPGITDVVFVAPTRLGKTFSLRCWFAWFIAGNPAPTNLYDSTLDKGRALSRKELQPLVEYNPVLRSRKPKNRHHYSDAQMLFDGAAVQILGGNSIAGAAGDTVVVVLGNEVEKWSGEQKGEAAMVELVRHRTESHENDRKHFFSSTPTSESGPIWELHEKGDKRKWFVPCPCCGTLQPLVWEQVRWDFPGAKNEDGSWNLTAVKKLTRYKCAAQECDALWDDTQRLTAIRNEAGGSRWQTTCQAAVPGYRSYSINGLYGPLKVNRLGELAVDFLTSRSTGFHSSRKDFWNSRMGQPWRDSAVTFGESRLRESMLPYKRGTCPEGWTPDIIILGCDVQVSNFFWVVMAFKWSGECRTIDWGSAALWEDLDRVQKTYHGLAGKSLVVMDVRYPERRAEVLQEIFRRTDFGWRGAEGFESSARLAVMRSVNPFIGTAKQGGNASVPVIAVDNFSFKLEWEKRFTREIPLWGCPTAVGAEEEKDLADYFAQLTDERRVKRARRMEGQSEWEFKSRSGNNHFFDCHCYLLSQFWLLQQARTAIEKATPSQTAVAPQQRQVTRVTRK